jgi:hypothetical protein
VWSRMATARPGVRDGPWPQMGTRGPDYTILIMRSMPSWVCSLPSWVSMKQAST